MKRIVLSIFTLAVTLLAGAQDCILTGRVIDNNNEPISYATIVLLRDSIQVVGGITNDGGIYTLKTTAGDYRMVVSHVAYNEHQQAVALRDSINLGDIVLQESSTLLGALEVKARLIRREADRYVVDVANSPHAIGKDAADVLKIAPGVWVSDDNISINGASGTKVYINEREVKMSSSELINHLRSISAEELQRIVVIPQAGAEYDASTTGGVIKIATKRHIDTGLMGTASLRSTVRPGLYSERPSVSLNYNRGKLNLYGRVRGMLSESNMETTEETSYREGTDISSNSEAIDKLNNYNIDAGVIYDLDERHSIGAEISHYEMGSQSTTLSHTQYLAHDNVFSSEGDYLARLHVKRTTATANYIYKLDDWGSEAKILADYTNSKTPGDNDYRDVLQLGGANTSPRDSIYRNTARNNYHLATVTASVDKFFSPKLQLRAGVKYTFNKNTSVSTHEWEIAPDQWQYNDVLSYNIGFTENIGAAYVAATSNLGRWSLVGGLRGEYTDFVSADKSIQQSYFALFPNANVSYMLSEDGSYMLIAQYARTIQRPGFWDLAPYENKSSEFVIMRGNPNLKATYNNAVSLTAILAYQYSLSAGVDIKKNPIEAITSRDNANPNLILIMPTNLPASTDYFANVSAPVSITPWWNANVSVMGFYLSQRYDAYKPARHHFSGMGNLALSFTLPKDFYIDMDGYYTTSTLLGNIVMGATGDVNVNFKKRMLEKRLTIALGFNNLIAPKLRSVIEEEDFSSTTIRHTSELRRNVSFALSYRFNSGKKFKAKAIESGSQEDLLRLGGN